ncbi:diaminopimelate epimerase [Coprobacillaceae bacterium CR2/5/TPMF4]|nr:diaminopimelate epimerase [Coprobacillaceae bacterium CR2/5/TPMF4]
MQLHFTKMEGIGNDYIYFDGISQEIPMDKEFITKISDRHFGIGSDGMIVVLPSDKYDFKMRMFNRDGSEAMMCGNGIRCFAKFIYDHQLSNKHVLNIETKAGLRVVELLFDGKECIGAKVDMGKPIINCKDIPCTYPKEQMINEPVEIGNHEYHLTSISMGNPHTVTFVDDLDSLDLNKIGPEFEHHQLFPESVNTEFVKVVNDKYVKMRVWERGSGETMACGTGACAVMYACYLNKYTGKKLLLNYWVDVWKLSTMVIQLSCPVQRLMFLLGQLKFK